MANKFGKQLSRVPTKPKDTPLTSRPTTAHRSISLKRKFSWEVLGRSLGESQQNKARAGVFPK